VARKPDAYYPLAPGRRLVYGYEEAERPGPGEAVRRVRWVEPGPAGVEALWEESLRGGGPDRSRTFGSRLEPEGLLEDGRWLLRAPLVKNAHWVDGPDRFEVASTEEEVQVPAGLFQGCLRVEFDNEDTGGGSIVFAPGVGMVLRRQWGERGGHRYELVRVDISAG